MAITFGTATTNTAGGSSITVTKPTVAVDDLMLLLVTSANAGAIAESGTSDWTSLVSETTNDPAVSLWYRVVTGGEPGSWTFTGNFNLGVICVPASGVDTVDPFDVTGTWTRDFGASTVGVSITTTESGVTLFGGYCVNSQSGSYTLTLTNESANVQAPFNLLAAGWETVGAAGLYTRNATSTISQWQRGVLTSLRPGAASSPTLPRVVIIVGSQPLEFMEV